MALPVKTTAQDVRDIVRYLKTKPTGATLTQARAAVDKRVLDARKLSAYGTWGFVHREDDRLTLADRGWSLARTPEQERGLFRAVVDGTRPYRSILEWLNHQEMATVTAIDVAAHLHQHHVDAVGDGAKDQTLRENAISFFNVAEAAGFGKMTLGRAGNPTRFDVSLTEVRRHIEGAASGAESPDDADPTLTDSADESQDEADVESGVELARIGDAAAAGHRSLPHAPMRVFISHGKNREIVEQIDTMLGLADIESEIAEAEETAAIPVPDKVLTAMRRCEAGIIAVTVEEGRKDESGNYVLNENVLIEIGAAFVLYDKRVVLLWDKRLKVPSNLQGLYRCEFEGEELSWSAGMKLMKAIQNFKRPDGQLRAA